MYVGNFLLKVKTEPLSFDSAHYRLIKRSIASGRITCSVKLMVPIQYDGCRRTQNYQLRRAGYSSQLLVRAQTKTSSRDWKDYRDTAYSINLKRQLSFRISHSGAQPQEVLGKHDVPVAFSAPTKKLSRLVTRVTRKPNDSRATQQCANNHRLSFAYCVSNVVHEIPFTCGRVYVGSTGGCVSLWLRELGSCLKAALSRHLVVHVSRCIQRH